MSDPARYDTVADTLRESVKPHRPDSVAACPPVSRDQAQRVATLIVRKFWPRGKLFAAGVSRMRRVDDPGFSFPFPEVRRVWISRLPTASSNSAKGLGRLVHDLSHDIFEAVYPNRRPHDPLHVKYETDVAAFVGTSKRIAAILWPELKPKREPVKPTRDEIRRAKLARLEVNLARWESKRRRADRAVMKIKRQQRGLLRALGDLEAADHTR